MLAQTDGWLLGHASSVPPATLGSSCIAALSSWAKVAISDLGPAGGPEPGVSEQHSPDVMTVRRNTTGRNTRRRTASTGLLARPNFSYGLLFGQHERRARCGEANPLNHLSVKSVSPSLRLMWTADARLSSAWRQ